MIDLHCHILPGVDDGADCLDTALRMAELAAASEISTIIATPHCNTRTPQKNFRSQALNETFAGLQKALDRFGLPVRVLRGSEVLLRDDVDALLDTQRLYTLADSRYLLVEFYFDEQPRFLDRALATVAAHGYVPVIAHPERYFCIQDMPEMARRWYERGYLLQLNKDSVLGDLGEGAYDTARSFLRQGLCHFIASDGHHFSHRRPTFTRLLSELEYFFPEIDPALLLEQNPQRVIENRQLSAL